MNENSGDAGKLTPQAAPPFAPSPIKEHPMTEIVLVAGTRHVAWQCKTCGVWATCPEAVYEQHRAEGGYHHCPNGHQWGWSGENSEREKLRRERDQLKQRLAAKDDEIGRLEREKIAQKGQITKLKNRASNGVCPCCTRSFTNLRRHMQSKHPEFKAEAIQ